MSKCLHGLINQMNVSGTLPPPNVSLSLSHSCTHTYTSVSVHCQSPSRCSINNFWLINSLLVISVLPPKCFLNPSTSSHFHHHSPAQSWHHLLSLYLLLSPLIRSPQTNQSNLSEPHPTLTKTLSHQVLTARSSRPKSSHWVTGISGLSKERDRTRRWLWDPKSFIWV